MAEIMITSSVLILVLLLFRKLCWGKCSRRLQYALWLLVVVRLLAPTQFFTSSLSVMNVIEYAKEAAYDKWQAVYGENDPVQGDASREAQITGGIQANGQGTEGEKREQNGTDMSAAKEFLTAQPGIVQSGEVQSGLWSQSGAGVADGKAELSGNHVPKALLIIYIVGVLVITGCLFICNVRFRRQLAEKRQLIGQEGRLKIYLAAHLESPCLCGVFAPAIYMNEEGLASEERKKHILLHEMTHYRHLDHIWTIVRSLCLVLYWFHPLVWVAAILSTEDSELACDEGTLERLGEEHRQAYGRTLIEMMTARSKSAQLLYCATGMINGKKEIKKRIMAIAAYKKQMIWSAVLVVVFALLLSACTAGNVEPESGDGEVLQDSETETADGQEKDSTDQQDDVGVQTDASSREEEGVQSGATEAEQVLKLGEDVIRNADGSFRLSEYEVDLTGDKIKEQIVFDVMYWTELTSETGEITEELLWEKLWSGSEIIVKILEGSEETREGTDQQEEILKEYSFSSVHAGNGNLAVMQYEREMCILLYSNAVYQGYGSFWYQVWQIMPAGEEPVLKAEKEASYVVPGMGSNEETVINQVIQVGRELDSFLSGYNTEILLNASSNSDACYLYGNEKGLSNGVRRQPAFDVFMAEVGGTGLELNIRDYFYPDGMESLTQLPENAEELILSGEILCMDVSKENHTAGRLDIDGDGEKEVLYLEAVGNAFNEDGWRDGIIDTNYRIRVNNQYYQNYCDIMYPVLMAYSPDGENILLAVYDDGPSGDPLTSFFSYDESGLHPAGSIPGDLRSETIDDDGVIHCSFRGDMIQTQWAWGYYYWNGSEIVRREDEVYYYLDDSEWRKREEWPLVLLQEITVYEERSESSTAIIMSPQEIQCVASDMKEWVLLDAEDGTKGWIRVVRFKVPALDDKEVYEVFVGLNMVD